MWRHLTTITLALAATTLAGCAVQSIHSGGQKSYPDRNEVPIASNFPTSTQLKLQAAEHWRRVANASAEALVRSLKANGACVPSTGCTTLDSSAVSPSLDRDTASVAGARAGERTPVTALRA